MSADNEIERAGNGRELLDRWLDSNYQVSSETLRQKKWITLPVPDILNPMEAEWLADAIRGQGFVEVIGVSCEYKGEPDVEFVQATRDSILTYNWDNSWRYAVMTSPTESFLYYKDELNRFYLICGSEDFVSQAYRCSWDTAKIMYFDQWVYSEHHNEQEKQFLTGIWNKYANFKP